jgi:hypothetical protein
MYLVSSGGFFVRMTGGRTGRIERNGRRRKTGTDDYYRDY